MHIFSVCLHQAFLIPLAQLLSWNTWSILELYAKNPKSQSWSTDSSGWNFHDGMVSCDPSEEFLNIKTQRL